MISYLKRSSLARYATQISAVVAILIASSNINLTPVTYAAGYVEDTVDVIVIDTGITETAQNSSHFKPAIDFTYDAGTENESVDCLGHGTMVSSLIIAETNADNVDINLTNLKIFPCENYDPLAALRALDWVDENLNEDRRTVINMSFGVDFIWVPFLDRKIMDLHKRGVVFVVAAGNDSGLACLGFPGNMRETITVGSIKEPHGAAPLDRIWEYSDDGGCVDFYSVGDFRCKEAFYEPAKCYGTSYAAPIVTAKVATLFKENPFIAAEDAKSKLKDYTNVDRVAIDIILPDPQVTVTSFHKKLIETPPLPGETTVDVDAATPPVKTQDIPSVGTGGGSGGIKFRTMSYGINAE